jgi:arsenite oxidase large subunit
MANFNYPGSLANSVCHAVPDPVTGNYRYKLGRGTLSRVGESPYKNNLSEMSLKPRPMPVAGTGDAELWNIDNLIRRT